MELEQRILADSINRLLESLNRISIFVVTAALAMVLGQNILIESVSKNVTIYSYQVPIFVADVLMGSFLVYLRTDFLDKLVLLRQVVTEQRAMAAFCATLIPYHPWRYNPIFPGRKSFPAPRKGRAFWNDRQHHAPAPQISTQSAFVRTSLIARTSYLCNTAASARLPLCTFIRAATM